MGARKRRKRLPSLWLPAPPSCLLRPQATRPRLDLPHGLPWAASQAPSPVPTPQVWPLPQMGPHHRRSEDRGSFAHLRGSVVRGTSGLPRRTSGAGPPGGRLWPRRTPARRLPLSLLVLARPANLAPSWKQLGVLGQGRSGGGRVGLGGRAVSGGGRRRAGPGALGPPGDGGLRRCRGRICCAGAGLRLAEAQHPREWGEDREGTGRTECSAAGRAQDSAEPSEAPGCTPRVCADGAPRLPGEPPCPPRPPPPLPASVGAAFSAWRTGEGGAVRTRILGLPTGVHTECHCVRLNRASPAGSHGTGTPRTPASTDVGFSQSRVPTRLPVRGCHLPGRGLGGDGRGERQHTAKLRAHPRKGAGDEGDSWSSPRGSARVPSPPPFKAISTFHTDVIP